MNLKQAEELLIVTINGIDDSDTDVCNLKDMQLLLRNYYEILLGANVSSIKARKALEVEYDKLLKIEAELENKKDILLYTYMNSESEPVKRVRYEINTNKNNIENKKKELNNFSEYENIVSYVYNHEKFFKSLNEKLIKSYTTAVTDGRIERSKNVLHNINSINQIIEKLDYTGWVKQ